MRTRRCAIVSRPNAISLLRALAERVGVAVGAADREHDRRAAAVLRLGAEQLARTARS